MPHELKSRYTAAITALGSCFKLKNGDEFKSFYASLQPRFYKENLSDADGFGPSREFDLYAVHNDETQKMTHGDEIYCLNNKVYKISRIEAVCLGGQALYLKAVVSCLNGGII